MKYAVFSFKGGQYKISEGEDLLLPLSTFEKEIVFDKVLLLVEDAAVVVGKPVLESTKVIASNRGEEKGEKIRVLKYKAKSRYRKVIGSRAKYSKVRIEKIESKA